MHGRRHTPHNSSPGTQMNMQTIMRPQFRTTAVLVVVAIVALICFELKRRNTRLVLTGLKADVRHLNEGSEDCEWWYDHPVVQTSFNDCYAPGIPDYLAGIGYPISIEIDGQTVGQDAINEIEANESLVRLVITNSSIDGVLDLNRFPYLEHLSFAGSSVRNVTFPKSWDQLRSFNAAGTGVNDEEIQFLLKCTNLQAVDLSGTRVSPDFLNFLQESCSLHVLIGPKGLELDVYSRSSSTER